MKPVEELRAEDISLQIGGLINADPEQWRHIWMTVERVFESFNVCIMPKKLTQEMQEVSGIRPSRYDFAVQIFQAQLESKSDD